MVTKTLLIAALFASPLAVSQDKPLKPQLIQPSSPFTPDGVVSIKETKLLSSMEYNKIEDGTLNGVKYQFYYTDGSGSFATSPDPAEFDNPYKILEKWHTACKKDIMDDTKFCYLQKDDIWVWLYGNGSIKILVGGDEYPGSVATIRIDSLPAMNTQSGSEGRFSTAQSKLIIPKLIAGTKVSTRYVNWPYQANVDKTTDLYGFDEAYQYIQWAIKQIK